jgi:hypothetical protein
VTPSWRQQCVEYLAADPTNWVRLAELFAKVERDIPIHLAMRRQANKYRSEDVGLNTARWRMFLSHVSPLVERVDCNGIQTYRAQRTDRVRLRPEEEPCKCGGPRYLSAWGDQRGRGRGREYTCLDCSRPQIVEPFTIEWIDPSELVKPIVAKPKLKPKPLPKVKAKPRYIVPTQAVTPTSPRPQPILRKITPTQAVGPSPKPIIHEREAKHFLALGLLNTYDEIWEECAFRCLAPRFQNDPKLVRKLRRALEAGMLDEFVRFNNRQDRFIEVNTIISDVKWLKDVNNQERYVFDLSKIDFSIFDKRGEEWASRSLTTVQRKRGIDNFIGAYAFGAQAIFSIGTAGRLVAIVKEIEKLVPKPKPQVQQQKTTWLTPIKNKARNVLSRFRNR